MDEQRFIDELFANPEDQDCLPVYADWLEDNGQPDRARLVRVQLELERGDRVTNWTERYAEEKELQQRCADALGVPRALRKKLGFRFERGLARASLRHGWVLTAADMRELGRHAVVKTLENFDLLTPDRLAHLALCPNVQALKLSGGRPLRAEDWHALAGLPHVESLTLATGHVTDDDVRHLSAMPQLREVDLSEARVSDAACDVLASLVWRS